jgi:peptide/nickel transport system permease protein
MPPFVLFLLRRLIAIPVTLFIMTAILYAIVSLATPEERASLYLPPHSSPFLPAEVLERRISSIIAEHGLDDPFPQQYAHWVSRMLRGDWGWSPVMNGFVLDTLVRRAPITAELTVYSVLLLIPLGLISGVMAGWRRNRRFDRTVRTVAFLGTSIPAFVLGLVLLSVFYVGLYWFPPGRTSMVELSLQRFGTFQTYTGFLTVDGLLNGRPDITLDAFRHLILPVFTLSLAHWATLTRIARASIIEEASREYIVAARARGLWPRTVLWRHAFRNAMLPALTSSVLSAASLVSGVFVVEAIFDMKGLSELIVRGISGTPDAALALGFAVFSMLLVLPLMLILDILKALVDPRIREGISE